MNLEFPGGTGLDAGLNKSIAELTKGLVPKEFDFHVEPVTADVLPGAARRLLDHREHMTIRLEVFYGEPVRLEVIGAKLETDEYRRLIALRLAWTKRIVEVGAVRIGLSQMPPLVRDEITAGQRPLGDILIRNDVFRQIEPRCYFRVGALPAQVGVNGQLNNRLYGRLGCIYCEGFPAIELLEIVVLQKNEGL